MKKFIGISCLLVFLIIIATPIFIYSYYNRMLKQSPSQSEELVSIEIPLGANTEKVAEILKDKNLIIDERIFIYYGKISGDSANIQAGKFNISGNLTIPQIYSVLNKPVTNEIIISFAEGLRGDEIATAIQKDFREYKNQEEVIFDKDEFIEIIYSTPSSELKSKYPFLIDATNLEGFLFPDSYRVFPDANTNEVINKLLENFNAKVYAKTKDLENQMFPDNFSYYEIINLASIVEREGVNSEERPVISSILLNRLNGKLNGIKLLQADATLLYDTGSWDASKLDKSSESPYNSYKFAGLPPTPICNPGYESIISVFESKESPYLYYLHKNGRFLTARTYSEHVANLRN